MGVFYRVFCLVRVVLVEGRVYVRFELEVRIERFMWQKCYVLGGFRVVREVVRVRVRVGIIQKGTLIKGFGFYFQIIENLKIIKRL